MNQLLQQCHFGHFGKLNSDRSAEKNQLLPICFYSYYNIMFYIFSLNFPYACIRFRIFSIIIGLVFVQLHVFLQVHICNTSVFMEEFSFRCGSATRGGRGGRGGSAGGVRLEGSGFRAHAGLNQLECG